MRTVKELEELHNSHKQHFGYVDITIFDCPPFVMFTNQNDCGICDRSIGGLTFEPGSTHLWTRFVPQATSVFDIGTRAGEFSLMAAALRQDIPIISCEANPDNFARLLVNMVANDVKNMHIHRVAVSHQAGFTKFTWVPKWLGHMSSGGHMMRNENLPPNATIVAVETKTIDAIAADHDLGARPLMKIDVEGAEQMVFAGMQNTLQKKPDIILECFVGAHCEYITGLTKPLGYNYFFVSETEKTLEARDKLYPATTKTENFNQFMSCRPVEEVLAIFNSKKPR